MKWSDPKYPQKINNTVYKEFQKRKSKPLDYFSIQISY